MVCIDLKYRAKGISLCLITFTLLCRIVFKSDDIDFNYIQQIIEASRGAVAQSVTVNRLVVGSIPTRRDEIFT